MDMQKMEAAFRTSHLIANYLFNTLTKEEKVELDSWIGNNKQLFDELTNAAQELNHLSKYNTCNTRRRFSNCKPLRSIQQYFLRYIFASNSSCA